MLKVIFLFLLSGFTYTGNAQLLSYSFVKNSIKWSEADIAGFLHAKGFRAKGKQAYKKVAASGKETISLHIVDESETKKRSYLTIYFYPGAYKEYFYLEKKIKNYCKKTEYFFEDVTQAFSTEYLHPDGTYFTLAEQHTISNKQKTTNYILYISTDKIPFDFRREL